MIGSFLTRALVMVLGYAYPAYECFKTVEMNKPEIEQLRFWCQYWILVAVLTVSERVGDAFISWLPMYSEAKLAFFVYLWCPKTKGTTYVYDTFFRPYVAKHETEIDRNLLELRTRAGDIAVLYWQKAASYGQTRFVEILQYVASQSQSQRPRPVQQQQARQQPPAGPARQQPPARPARQQPPPAGPTRQQPLAGSSRQPTVVQAAQQPIVQSPSSPSKGPPIEPIQEAGPSPAIPLALPQTSVGSNPTGSETKSREAEPMQVEVSSGSANEESNPSTQETVMDEAIRITRARLRKTRAAAATSASTR